MLIALQLVERCALPLGLMPAARITLALVAPVLGAMLALVLELGAGDHVALGSLEPSVIGAWLVLALGAWVTVHFQEGRPARVAVIGSAGFASDLAAELAAAGIRGYEVIGWFGAAAPAAHSDDLECLGTLDGVRAAVTARRIELLVWAREEAGEGRGGVDSDPDPCALIADACLDLPVRMIEASQLYEELLGHVPLGTIDSAWFRYIMHPRFRPTSPLSKRCSDLAIALPTAILALPLLGALAIAIKLSDSGPVLYRQRRIGERGRDFNVLKLRTMVTDAEAAGPAVVRAERRPRDPSRQAPSPDPPRRAASALERPPGRDDAGRSPAGAARDRHRARATLPALHPTPSRQAGDHRAGPSFAAATPAPSSAPRGSSATTFSMSSAGRCSPTG